MNSIALALAVAVVTRWHINPDILRLNSEQIISIARFICSPILPRRKFQSFRERAKQFSDFYLVVFFLLLLSLSRLLTERRKVLAICSRLWWRETGTSVRICVFVRLEKLLFNGVEVDTLCANNRITQRTTQRTAGTQLSTIYAHFWQFVGGKTSGRATKIKKKQTHSVSIIFILRAYSISFVIPTYSAWVREWVGRNAKTCAIFLFG